jgi:hypothetical protein
MVPAFDRVVHLQDHSRNQGGQILASIADPESFFRPPHRRLPLQGRSRDDRLTEKAL